MNLYPAKTALLASLIAITGCSASLDKSSVTAESGAPESTRIEIVEIPYDQTLPTYVVAVEPFVFRETLQEGTNQREITFRRGGEQLAAKMTTVLANVGNFSVLDGGLRKTKRGHYHTKISRGEVGPFVIKGTVTEFTEAAEASSKDRGTSLGWAGAITGIAGAITGNRALTWAGAGVAAANPTYEDSTAEKKGMVGIDFRIVDGKTGRIVGAFKSTGTFKSAAASSGFSLFGIGGSEKKFAQSVLGQAITAALNDAAKQTHSKLSGRYRSARLK